MCPHPSVWTRVLGLALAAAVLSPAARGADVDKYLPADTEWVTSVNVRQILDSALVKKYGRDKAEAEIKKGETQKVLSTIGLDPLKDVTTLTIAGPGTGDLQNKWVLIVHGSFDLGKIHDAAAAHAKDHPDDLKIEKEGDIPIYEGHPPAGGRNALAPKAIFAAFLDRTVLVASGSRDDVLDAVAKHGGKKEAKVGKKLQALIAKQDNLKSVWLVGLVPDALKKQLANNAETSDFADKMQSLTGSINITDGIKAKFRIHTTEEEAAGKIKDLLDGVRNIAILGIGTRPEIKQFAPVITEVIKALEFTQEKQTAVISLTITPEMIEKGIKMVHEPKETKEEKDKP